VQTWYPAAAGLGGDARFARRAGRGVDDVQRFRWQAAYAELWFTPVYWPDFGKEHLYEALRDYQKRDRRFGAVEDE